MTKIPFKISARTAKLIGRENFSNPEGAVIELVKNCYDADAKECLVIFDIVCEGIPEILSTKEFKKYATTPIVKRSYKLEGKQYVLNSRLTQEKLDELRDFFFVDNAIYIIDNGDGMTNKEVKDQWMEIGTGNKETKFVSTDGRIKTGAKGIGRFALDRLGFQSEMWTVPKNKKSSPSRWSMDWRQFDHADKGLQDINAELMETKLNIAHFLNLQFKEKVRLQKKIHEVNFSNGTIIKITGLKDNWLLTNQETVFKSLEALVPPRELAIPFSVSFYSLQDLRLFGEVETAFFNDFDYKVEADFDARKNGISITITRDELDLKIVKKKYTHVFAKAKKPYDLQTLAARSFTVNKTAFELLSWEKNTTNTNRFKNLGDFSFSFYFLKNTSSADYSYKSYNATERRKVLDKFGGIKIYRDSFRVRPYGDVGNDWLKLGERSAQSPAGAGQAIGAWRVGPNQIAGLVKVSRIHNPNLIDKSDRGALIENDAFDTLKKLTQGIIREFELDRSKILNPFYIEQKKEEVKAHEVKVRIEAEKIAEKIVEERIRVEREVYGKRPGLFKEQTDKQQKESFKKIIEEGFHKIDRKDEEDAEIAQVRMLASLGLIVSSFAHELKEVKNNTADIKALEKIYQKVVPETEKKQREFTDGVNIINTLKTDNEKIAHWVDYSLTAIKKDKRKRGALKLDSFFATLDKQWIKVLKDRNIQIAFGSKITKPYNFRAFEMDMNTIFSNLISNSIDSFNILKKIQDRKVNINAALVLGDIEITYSDNGAGLPKVFQKNKEDIFLPFTTSKKDKDGNDIGTGLGMYLVKNVITDNNGTIDIIDTKEGFKVKIRFPIRKLNN